MKGSLEFFIPILPKAQKRSRSRAIQVNGRWTATNYKDKDQRIAEDNFRALLYEHKPAKPIEGEVWLHLVAVLPIPKSKSKKFKAEALGNIIAPTTKPDLDNLIKHLKDCMKGIFYVDDRQIVYIEAAKKYGNNPGWAIRIFG